MRLVPWIPPLFRDRAAAGRTLSEAVAALRLEEPVVVGVARGGVAVAAEIAHQLRAPLTAVDVERVNAYGLRLGAVTAHGPPYLREGHGVPEAEVESALERARRAAATLEARLEHETLPVAGRTTLIVDDGLITGLTLAAACRWARAEQVLRLIAATPIGHVDGLARLREEADLVVCPHPLEQIAVVGQAYDSFDPWTSGTSRDYWSTLRPAGPNSLAHSVSGAFAEWSRVLGGERRVRGAHCEVEGGCDVDR